MTGNSRLLDGLPAVCYTFGMKDIRVIPRGVYNEKER